MGGGIITSEAQLRSHLSMAHPALSPQEITSEVHSASELVYSRCRRRRCPFCLTLPASTPGQYFSHIGRHLQEVALAAIPMSLMPEDTGSLEGLDDSDGEVQREDVSRVSSGMADSQVPAASVSTDEDDYFSRIIMIDSIVNNISSVIGVVKRLQEATESYNDIVDSTASHFTDLRSTLKTLLTWHTTENSGKEITPQLHEDIYLSLNACAILVKVILGQLYESDYMPRLEARPMIEYRWLEDVLKGNRFRLEDLVRALRLLLTICRCRTLADQNQLLAMPASREIIEKVRTEMMELDDRTTKLPQDSLVHLDADPIPRESPDDMRLRMEEQEEDYSYRQGLSVATIKSITDIALLVENLADYGKDWHKDRRERLAFDESVEELSAIVKRFEVISESLARDGDLERGQIERSKDFDRLQTIESSIHDALLESRSRGFTASARRLLSLRDTRASPISIGEVKGWTANISSMLDKDHYLVARDHQQKSRSSSPRSKYEAEVDASDRERRAYAERAAKAEREALRRATRLADFEYFEGQRIQRSRIGNKVMRRLEAVNTSMRRPQQQLEESEGDKIQRERLKYEEVRRLEIEKRRRRQKQLQLQQLEESERNRIQRERIKYEEVRRLEIEERRRRVQ